MNLNNYGTVHCFTLLLSGMMTHSPLCTSTAMHLAFWQLPREGERKREREEEIGAGIEGWPWFIRKEEYKGNGDNLRSSNGVNHYKSDTEMKYYLHLILSFMYFFLDAIASPCS